MSRLFTLLIAIPDWIVRQLLLGIVFVTRSAGRVISVFGKGCVWFIAGISRALMAVPSLMRFLFMTSKAGFIIAPIALLAFLVMAAITNPYVKADLEYAHERSSAAELIDRDGRWIGIIPPAEFSDWSDGSVLPADQAAIPLIKIPPVWRSCAVFLEDRDFDGISRWFGIDPIAMLKSGWQTITFRRRRGASTLYMQVVRMLDGRSPDQDEAPGEVAFRKIAELFGASALTSILEQKDPQAAARFVGMHLPLVIGTAKSSFGEPLYGVELASRILFGVAADALTPEQQATLAAAIKTPILLAPANDAKGLKRAEARWRRVKERAEYCLRNAFTGPSDAQMAEAASRLSALDLPQPQIDPELRKILPTDTDLAWKIMVNPVRRTLFFARYELSALMWELDRAVGTDWRGKVVSVRLTTSAIESRPFAEAVIKVLRQLQASLLGLKLNLIRYLGEGDQADVVVASIDSEGRVRRIYSSHQNIFWNRKAPVGSIAKMVAAVALGRTDHPGTPYCPAPIPGVASSSGGDPDICHHKNAWMPAREAFARSNNKAIHWALRRLNDRILRATAAGLELPPFGSTPPATALTIGTFELTPAEMLRVAASIGTGVTGAPQDVHDPHLIESISLLKKDGAVETKAIRGDAAIKKSEIRRIFTPRIKSFVANVLQATSDVDGTLHLLHSLRGRLNGHLYAKTGTVSIAGSTQDLHIAGTYLQDGKPWSFVVTVGAPSASKPLGRELLAGQIASLAEADICGGHPRSAKLARVR